MIAVPVAGCGSSVTPAVDTDSGAADVGAPIDRQNPVDTGTYRPDVSYGDLPGFDAGTPRVDVPLADVVTTEIAPIVDVGQDAGSPTDTATPGDSAACAPYRASESSPGTCEETVVYPCGLPREAQVDAGTFINYELCRTLCAPLGDGFFGGGCRRLEQRSDGSDQIACTTCAVGRRSDGLMAVRGAREAGPVGDFFARVATLEWASVTAFERLADDLARFGAPSELVAEARRSADDERRHTDSMGSLARRFGAPVREPEFAATDARSLEAVAVENAVEGCVRETFGALVATWQARSATDAGVAAALRDVAADETRHAEFSWALGRWADGVLDEGARARVRAAREGAVAELRAELDGAVDPALVSVAGMPDRATGLALFAAMTDALD